MANPPGQGAPGLVPPTQDQQQQQVPPPHQMGASQPLQQGTFGGYPPSHGMNGGKQSASTSTCSKLRCLGISVCSFKQRLQSTTSADDSISRPRKGPCQPRSSRTEHSTPSPIELLPRRPSFPSTWQTAVSAASASGPSDHQ